MLILQLWFMAILFAFMPSWQGFKGLIFYPFAALFCLLGPRLMLGANNKKETLSPLHFAVTVYLIIALCSLLPSGRSASDGLLEFSRLLIYFSLILFLSRLSISQFLKLASLSTFSAALIGFLNWLNLNFIHYWEHLGALAPIGQVTLFADVMALHLPMALYLMYLHQKNKNQISWKAVCYFISFFWIWMGLWLSGTRASLLGVLIALIFATFTTLYFKLSTLKKTLLFLSILSILFVFTALFQNKTARGISTLERLSQSTQVSHLKDINEVSSGRLLLYQKTIQFISEKPILGLGLGNFVFHFPRFGFYFDHPHQELLYQAAELGILGLIAYLTLIYLFLKKLKLGIQKSKRERQILLLLSATGFAIFFCSWQFSTNSLFSTSRLLSAWYLALCIKLCPTKNWGPSHSSFKIGLNYLQKILLSFCGLFLSFQLCSAFYSVRANLSEERNEKQNLLQLSQKLYPFSYSNRLNHFYELIQDKKLNEAVEYSYKLENLYPEDPEILLTRAYSEFSKKDSQATQYYVELVLDRSPHHPEAKKLQMLVPKP